MFNQMVPHGDRHDSKLEQPILQETERDAKFTLPHSSLCKPNAAHEGLCGCYPGEVAHRTLKTGALAALCEAQMKGYLE